MTSLNIEENQAARKIKASLSLWISQRKQNKIQSLEKLLRNQRQRKLLIRSKKSKNKLLSEDRRQKRESRAGLRQSPCQSKIKKSLPNPNVDSQLLDFGHRRVTRQPLGHFTLMQSASFSSTKLL